MKYQVDNNNYLYLIRTKILSDIIDSKNDFSNFQEIINYIYSYSLPKINYIPIAYSPDNKYTSLCIYFYVISFRYKRIFYFYNFFFINTKKFQ